MEKNVKVGNAMHMSNCLKHFSYAFVIRWRGPL
jgi:hypothetical protein